RLRHSFPTRRSSDLTTPDRYGRFLNPDHPHAGGENLTCQCIGHAHRGPSPRGWGERARARVPCLFYRTIPTRVGRTPLPKPHGSDRKSTRLNSSHVK